MQDNVDEMDFNSDSVVDVILGDSEIAKLPLGSEEQKAAINAKLIKTDDESESNTPAGEAPEQNADDNSDISNSADDDNEDAGDEQPVKKSKGVQKRIDELTREREELKRQLEELKNGDRKPAEREPTARDITDRPDPTDYETTADFYEAIAEWKFERLEAKKSEQQQQKQAVSAWETKAASFQQSASDYGDIVNVDSVTQLNTTPGARAYFNKLENGPQLLYTLLQDEGLSEQFASADDVDQVALLAELKAQLSPKKKATVSNAPTPPKALPKGKGSAPGKSIYDDNLSDAEFDRLYELERKKARK